MNEHKPWYLSRTIWASIVTIVAGAGGLAGLPVEQVDKIATTEYLLQIVTALSGIAALLGRVRATARLI
ncbi:hypothetical protein [Nitratireductor basaltis]|uniref:Holin n=1 Tax=Nitratireductor basaltis TaxID=472175 RepID=A0A084UCF5_9HYPH|nr:hypothetical protein [Nitratireductor basaltis]KFB10641.1 hypothetical protein EL18_01679 [Nitratireductor basaltis]